MTFVLRPGICEKYGVEPDSQLVEDEPKNVTWRWQAGFLPAGKCGTHAQSVLCTHDVDDQIAPAIDNQGARDGPQEKDKYRTCLRRQ